MADEQRRETLQAEGKHVVRAQHPLGGGPVVSFLCPACGRRESGPAGQGEHLCRCGARVKVG